MKHMPKQGDAVQERNTLGMIRQGVVEKIVEVDGEDYVEVQFTDELYADQIPLGYFTRSDDSNGYWNDFLKRWCLDPTDEQIKANQDPDAIAFLDTFNRATIILNNKLLMERLHRHVNCTLIELETLTIEAELQARELGKFHPYYQTYISLSLDYKRLIDLRVRGDVTWQTSTVALSKRYGLDAAHGAMLD